MKKLGLIIFDFDGTLVDTTELIIAAFHYAAEQQDLKIVSPNKLLSKLGVPLADIFRHFYPDANIKELVAANKQFVISNAEMARPYPGMTALLQKLHYNNIKMGILSSGDSAIENILKQNKLDKYFITVVHAEIIKNPKPSTDGFYQVCRNCDVLPENTIIVGDSIYDIIAGKKAKALATVALTHNTAPRPEILEAKPDHIACSAYDVQKILEYYTTGK